MLKNIYLKVECSEVRNSGGCQEGYTEGWHEMKCKQFIPGPRVGPRNKETTDPSFSYNKAELIVAVRVFFWPSAIFKNSF